MVKKLCSILIIALLAVFCAACGNSNEAGNETEEEIMTDVQLITVEDLIKTAKLDPDAYDTEFLQAFINDFKIDYDNVKTLNITRILRFYSPKERIDVTAVFNDSLPARKADFTKGAVALAFFENADTDLECVYYDFEKSLRYRTEQGYLFEDLSVTEPTAFTDAEGLLSAMEALGVFEWESADSADEIVDGTYMSLVVKYSDGSSFKLTAGGIISELLPESYIDLRQLLLG